MKKSLIMAVFILLGVLVIASGVTQAETSAGEDVEELEPQAPSPPAGQSARYVLPYYTSQTTTPPGARSTTVVNVYNQNAIACNVGVQFQFAFGTTNVCSITLSIPAKESRLFCSRPVNDPLAPCSVSCSPALAFNTGHAFVSSTTGTDCAKIAVDAQLAFTRDAADDLLEGITKLSIVTINAKNKGD